jgi:hypothetical protein
MLVVSESTTEKIIIQQLCRLGDIFKEKKSKQE